MIFINAILVVILFFFLGKSAEILVDNTKKISERFKIKIFILGVLLGILTTTPELFLGINAITKNSEAISIGNLFGGILVIFGLLFGLNLVLNKKIETDGNIKKLLLNFVFIFSPLLLCLKGSFTKTDGIMFILFYIIIIFYSNKYNYIAKDEVSIINKNKTLKEKFEDFKDKNFLKEILFLILSLVSLIFFSDIIINLSETILKELKISEFVIGLMLFSIGTNLPELMVMIKASKNNNSDLSISHLVGSAMANIFVLSLLSLFKGFVVSVNYSYISMLIIIFITLTTILIFYKTNKSFSRKEGVFLLFVYVIFIGFQLFFMLS